MMEKNSPDLVRILFRFYSDILDKQMVETVWATIVDIEKGFYQIDNIPFYIPLISSDDIVYAQFDESEQMLTYKKTIEHSGNSTIHIILIDDAVDIAEIRESFSVLGCITESFGDRYLSMEVPAKVKYNPIKQVLDNFESNGLLDYKESCLSINHDYR